MVLMVSPLLLVGVFGIVFLFAFASVRRLPMTRYNVLLLLVGCSAIALVVFYGPSVVTWLPRAFPVVHVLSR